MTSAGLAVAAVGEEMLCIAACAGGGAYDQRLDIRLLDSGLYKLQAIECAEVCEIFTISVLHTGLCIRAASSQSVSCFLSYLKTAGTDTGSDAG